MSIAQNRLTGDGAYRMSQRVIALAATFRGADGVPPTHGYEVATGGTLTEAADPAGALLTVTGDDTSRVLVQTHEAYRAGRGTHALVHSQAVPANQIRRCGRFDSSTGAFFDFRSTGAGVVVRNADGDVRYPAIVWGEDRADGTGDLPVLDVTKAHRYSVEIPDGGAGLIRFFIDDVLVHTVDARIDTRLESPILPSAIEIVNSGTSSAGSIRALSDLVALDDAERTLGFTLPIAPAQAQPNPGVSVALRVRSATPINRAVAIPKYLHISGLSGPMGCAIYIGSTAGSPYEPVPGSRCESYVGTSDLTTDATLLGSFIVPTGELRVDLSAFGLRLRALEHLDGSSTSRLEQLHISFVGTGAENFRGVLAWDEIQP